MSAATERLQELLDRFYFENGQCCAGCDWWRYVNSVVGECTRTAPVAGIERFAMIGLQAASLSPGAGHIMTMREHHCGEFKDEFDWSAMPADYLRRIGRARSIKD